MANALLQTLVSPELAAWVKQQASAEGITVAAWIRRLIMRESNAQQREKK